jgi:hypothetical protein
MVFPATTKESIMELQEAYKQKRAAQLKEWSAQINLLEAKVENAEADLKIKYSNELVNLRSRQHAAAEKMKELAKASGDAWAQVKETSDKIWEDLKIGLAEAQAKFH